MSKNSIPTIQEFDAAFVVGVKTGVLTNRVNRGRAKAGDVVGGVGGDGYIEFRFRNRRYVAHRVIFLLTRGHWPVHEIDHINGIRHDNRPSNLRDVTRQANAQNIKKAKGYCRNRKNWRAYIHLNGSKRNLGTFKTKEEARSAYLTAKRIYHPTAPINHINT